MDLFRIPCQCQKRKRKFTTLNIHSEKGGSLKVKSPFAKFEQKINGKIKISKSESGFIQIDFAPNSSIDLKGI